MAMHGHIASQLAGQRAQRLVVQVRIGMLRACNMAELEIGYFLHKRRQLK